MLPKSRILSALIVGLGVALMVGGLISPVFIKADGRLPLDLENTTWTLTDEGASSRLMTDPDGRVLETPVTKQVHLTVQQPASESTASVRLGSSLARESLQADQDRLISAGTWSYQMDRVSGEALAEADYAHTIGFPPESVAIDGVWFKFPTNAEKTTYDVFSETLHESRPATFIEAQERDGREIYLYRQEIAPTNVAELRDGLFLTTEINGEQAALFHSATTDYYVDQVTGLVVDVDTSVEDFYALSADSPEREVVLVFDASRDPAQAEEALAEIAQVTSQRTSELIRWGVIVAGGVIAVAGLIGAFRGGNKTRRRSGTQAGSQ